MLIPLVDFAAPSIDFLNLAPIVAPLVAGALSVLIEAFVPREHADQFSCRWFLELCSFLWAQWQQSLA